MGTPLLRVSAAGLAERIGRITEVEDAEVARRLAPRADGAGDRPRAGGRRTRAGGRLGAGRRRRRPVGAVAEVPEGLPEVTVPLGDSSETAPALRAVLAVLAALPGDLLGQVAQAGASGTGQVTFTLDDGATVRWGSAEENELKTEVLRVLRQEPARRVRRERAPLADHRVMGTRDEGGAHHTGARHTWRGDCPAPGRAPSVRGGAVNDISLTLK